MASMVGVMNTFSTQTSMAAPEREAGRIYCLRAKEPTRSASGVEGSLFRVDPSPRLRLGTFNGRRPSRESLDGNGADAPPVSRFLYRPHYRRTKSESQYFSLLLHCGSLRLNAPLPAGASGRWAWSTRFAEPFPATLT